MSDVNRAVYDRFIEFLALGAVISNLEENNWGWLLAPKLNQKGFDLTATKDGREIKIEVKGRSMGKYSKKQEGNNIRPFNFSEEQYRTCDFFIPVFVFPTFRKCVVIPKQDFNNFTTPKRPYRITLEFDSDSNSIKPRKFNKDGREIDANKYLDRWFL